jgi:two-component system chemotaxis response regulator CheY
MDGLQTLQIIKSLQPDAYVVIASGTSAVDKVKTAIKLGAKGFMVKPYNSEKLREVVRNFRGGE